MSMIPNTAYLDETCPDCEEEPCATISTFT